jgi:hypothetical protein
MLELAAQALLQAESEDVAVVMPLQTMLTLQEVREAKGMLVEEVHLTFTELAEAEGWEQLAETVSEIVNIPILVLDLEEPAFQLILNF